jgi:hypothetical protein
MRSKTSILRALSWLACIALIPACSNGDGNGKGIVPVSAPTTLGCGAEDTPETGIRGDIPRADQDSGRAAAGYNCGLSLVSELGVSGATQGYDHCAYVRTGANSIKVIDLKNPTNPVEVMTLTPAGSNGAGGTSETMRVVATRARPGFPARALLASGSSVYDIRDCDNPVHKGDIQWPGILPWPAGLSHDIRISLDGTKVYAGIGAVIADISDLDHPENWTVANETCRVAANYHPLHQLPALFDLSLCELGMQDQAPQLSHGPDGNDTGTRLYIGNQGIPASVWVELDTLRIVDLTQDPPKVLDTAPGPGHSIDWFRIADGREFILHANEITVPHSSCLPYPRSSNLGFAFEAFITEVTGDKLVRRSTLVVDINKPENCLAKLESGQNPSVAYHSVDNPYQATFAMVSFGDGFIPGGGVSGLRVFDIRDPSAPKEVAYFNKGALQHASATHYDASRGLLYMPGANATQVLELQPQLVKALGLKYPTDPAYPRYPNGRAATPSD